ncbi:MAG TPA: thiamine pyrophosphate-dependent enzyme, partial [bacterium]|nr:thiamine pyrophosphate-dependent enzyme [bacterium]
IVIDGFRRGLDIAGHVSWIPGGTQLNGGRLGIMVPVAVGHALAKKAKYGDAAWMITHCGDAAWVSGQALNGFLIAALHGAPMTFVMHRNGIQLSNATHKVLDRDPRPVIKSLGIEIIEIPSIHDRKALYAAFVKGRALAAKGKPNLIYPTGYRSSGAKKVTVETLGKMYGIRAEVRAFAEKNKVKLTTPIWIPGALMSFRDVTCMLENVFLANDLPGGKGHHDGHMKGRDVAQVLGNPMLRLAPAHAQALAALKKKAPRVVVTQARPKVGSENLVVPAKKLATVPAFPAGKKPSPRAGSELGYALVAEAHPDQVFVVSCDLNPSTKLAKACSYLAPSHQFEVSIQEQAATLMTNGLATGLTGPQLNVVSTFAAFFEGIAREGCEMWRYQRNLNGANEGLNVAFHLSHVGACTGRDHFSGWSLDWVNLAIGYLPYLQWFYAPADANAALVAVLDMAKHYGAGIIGIPRDELPVLTKQGTDEPLWLPTDEWKPTTQLREYPGAERVILALGSPAFLAQQAADELTVQHRLPTDVFVINGLPLGAGWLDKVLADYPGGVVTIEDGLIGTPASGWRGLAGVVAADAAAEQVPFNAIGITDPTLAPSEGFAEVWEHFGITQAALVQAVKGLK